MLNKPRINALLKLNDDGLKRIFYYILFFVVLQLTLSILSILLRDISTIILMLQVLSGIFLVVFVFIELRSLRKTNKIIYGLINETDDSKFKII